MNLRPDQRLAISALSQLGSTALGLVNGVVLSIIVARALGPTDMGSYALALLLVSALEAVAGLGLARTALKFAAELSHSTALPGAIWWLLARRSASALIAAVGLAAAAPVAAAFFQDSRLAGLLMVGSGLLLASLLASVLESTLEGSSRFDLLARASVGLTPLHLVATLAALWLGGGAIGVLVAQVVFGVANLVVLAAMAWRAGTLAWRASKPAEDLTCRMTRFARQGYGLSLLTFIVRDRSEVLVLGALATAQQVGFYSVALGAAEAAMRLGPWIVASVFFPLIAAGFADPDRQAIRTRYAQCLRYLALTAAPLALGGIALSEAGVAVVFGSAYAPMVPVLRVTLVAAAAAALAQGPAALLTVAERQDWILRVRAPLALANLILNVALVPRFAALGAAWANLAVAAAEAFVLGAVAWRFDGWAPLASMGHTFAAAAASAGVATLVLAGRTDAAGLLSSMLLAVVVYVLVLVISRFFRPEDAQVLGPLLEHTRFASMVRHRRFGRGLSVSSPK